MRFIFEKNGRCFGTKMEAFCFSDLHQVGHICNYQASVLKIVMPWEEICIIIIDLNTLLVALVETYFNFAHSSYLQNRRYRVRSWLKCILFWHDERMSTLRHFNSCFMPYFQKHQWTLHLFLGLYFILIIWSQVYEITMFSPRNSLNYGLNQHTLEYSRYQNIC